MCPSLAAEAGFHESLRYLLDEVGVPDASGALRAALPAGGVA